MKNKLAAYCVKALALAPIQTIDIARAGFTARLHPSSNRTIFVGTHHKALTVFMARIFRAYAFVCGKKFSFNSQIELSNGKAVVHYHHSLLDVSKYPKLRGIHIRRDPRDLLVSNAMYHVRSDEPWLHEQGLWFSDQSYAERIRSLPSMEERLLFEMEHAGAENIRQMLTWDYTHPGIAEFKYEDLVGPNGQLVFIEGLTRVGFSEPELRILSSCFRLFSQDGVLANRHHIRDPRSTQWQTCFSEPVIVEFEKRFPGALRQLGYSAFADSDRKVARKIADACLKRR